MITRPAVGLMRFTVQAVLTPDVEVAARSRSACGRMVAPSISRGRGGTTRRDARMVAGRRRALRAGALVGAMPGDVLGPLALKEGHLVLAVGNKRLPAEDDTTVRGRAERALLAARSTMRSPRRDMARDTLADTGLDKLLGFLPLELRVHVGRRFVRGTHAFGAVIVSRG